jgi:hypothetical protein
MIWAVLLSCTISSYWLGFDKPSIFFFNITRIIETLFYIDFALNFITATKNPITLVETNDLFSIVKQYFYGYALRDLIALIPFESFFKDNSIIKLCLILRLLRI